MLVIVIIHVLGVLLSSWLYKENLIRSMLDGKKYAKASMAITSRHPLVAIVIMLSLIGFWLWILQ